MSVHILFLFLLREITCENSLLLSTLFPVAVINIWLVQRETHSKVLELFLMCLQLKSHETQLFLMTLYISCGKLWPSPVIFQIHLPKCKVYAWRCLSLKVSLRLEFDLLFPVDILIAEMHNPHGVLFFVFISFTLFFRTV